jgi:predicted DNA-binding transcriptional regulator AlpA
MGLLCGDFVFVRHLDLALPFIGGARFFCANTRSESRFMTPHNGLLTSKQAATWLQVSAKTLWNHTAPRGRLKVIRLGKNVRYRLTDLEEFAEQHSIGATDNGKHIDRKRNQDSLL